MGLILDSSVLIAAGRQGQNARQMLTAIARSTGETEIALSVVTLIELALGAARADTAQRKQNRQQSVLVPELLTALPIHLVGAAGPQKSSSSYATRPYFHSISGSSLHLH